MTETRDVKITLQHSHHEIDEAASRRERHIAKGRLAEIHDRFKKEWDGADRDMADDMAALKIACDVLDVLERQAEKRDRETT